MLRGFIYFSINYISSYSYPDCEISLKMDTPNDMSLYLHASFCAPRQENIVEKLQYEILQTSVGTFCSSHTERWGGRCKQRVYECFTLCWLGSLGHRSPAWVLFTALPAHKVSLPGLEQGQSSSVSRFLSQVLSQSGQPRVTVGPVKARMAALLPTNTAVFHWLHTQGSGSKSATFWRVFFFFF